MPELTIKDLPDTSKIDDKLTYVVQGIHWRAIISIIKLLWRGDNIGKGDATPNQNGDSGYFLSVNPGSPQILQAIKGSSVIPPLNPFSDASVTSTAKVTITYGTYGGAIPTISGTALVTSAAANIITLGGSDTLVYCQCDFTYSSGGIVTIVDAEIKSGTSVPSTTISGGSGTLYQELFGVTITTVGGNKRVTFAPAVGGSQNFNVCLAGPSVNGPFGV